MIRLMIALAILFSSGAAGRADELPQFGGEWKTTMGAVTLEQKDHDVTGRIEFFKLPLEVVPLDGLALENDAPIGLHVHDDLADVRFALLALARRWNLYIQFVFAEREIPGHDEENEQHKQYVHHRRDLKTHVAFTAACVEAHGGFGLLA